MRGSLEDLEMKSILEFFRSNHQTGELIVAGTDGFAKIQLLQGKVIGAELGDQRGIAALLKVLDWREGEFEFRRENASSDASTGADLLPAITLIRNAGPLPAGGASPPPPVAIGIPHPDRISPSAPDARLSDLLCETLGSSPSIWYLAVLAADGVLRAEATSDLISPAGVEECRTAVRSILQHYVQPRLERFILEIPPLTLVAGRLRRDTWLLLASDRNTPLGEALRLHQKLAKVVP